MAQILKENGISVKDYLRDLYENTPLFDEIPPNFDDELEIMSYW